MDQVLSEICTAIRICDDSPIRAGIDREDERVHVSQIDSIMRRTYRWAFFPQMLVLLIASVMSGYLPQRTAPVSQTDTRKRVPMLQPKKGNESFIAVSDVRQETVALG
ncbi:hypothetical protein [Massilia sp. H6]|uniref:hypothetical protein n=1 Tax=Massilia sp. H6 TaxID=2970464 RepID=UPI0021694DCD|nr:hypothetical protein [Massilia sp. H6]UVW27416.1 hypothetical protein NRS07_12685 [Massilia sp. H6]